MSDHNQVEDSKETLEIQNVVASTAIDHDLDLQMIAMDLEGVNFDPEQFPGLIYRTQNPQTTALVFRSGKMTCTGAESVPDIHIATKIVIKELSNIGIKVPENPDIEVQNIVTSGDLGQTLHLESIAIGFGLENTEYEPEQFPGLIYRPDELDIVTLLFGSGKIVVTGGKEPEDAEAAIEHLIPKLTDLNLLGS